MGGYISSVGHFKPSGWGHLRDGHNQLMAVPSTVGRSELVTLTNPCALRPVTGIRFRRELRGPSMVRTVSPGRGSGTSQQLV